jgi:hypothetical protein
LSFFSASVKSEELGTEFNRGRPNISKEDKKALTTLKTLQREKKIHLNPVTRKAR